MARVDYLFFEESLDAALRSIEGQVASIVDRITEDQFLISSDEDLIAYVEAKLVVYPLELHEDQQTMTQEETQVDVSRDPNRYFSPGNRGPFNIPGTRVVIKIPFTGDEWIFNYRTNPYSNIFPTCLVRASPGARNGNVVITITLPHDADKNRFKAEYEQQLKMLRECIERSSVQIGSHNSRIAGVVRRAIEHRRERLGKHADIASLLEIPLEQDPDAPSIEPVRLEIKQPPPLPKPPKSGLQREPGIAQEQYELILDLIRHQGRSFESTPGTYALHGEEGLRDIMLSQLNGHFKGRATGETFRGKGKTDIRIEEEDRAAFVAECKVWTGQSDLNNAVDQLLSYLTWRDGKAAIVLFNKKNKNFSEIPAKVRKTLLEHQWHIQAKPNEESGECRMVMRSAEDEGRRVTVHVFVFDLYKGE